MSITTDDTNITGFILYACNNYGFTFELAKATIKQFGGEANFKQAAEMVANGRIKQGVEGWKTFEEATAFYNDNTKHIKAWLMKSHDEFEYEASIPEYIAGMEMVRGLLFELIEIQAFLALNDKTQSRYTHFVTGIGYQIAMDLCRAYQRFTENKTRAA